MSTIELLKKWINEANAIVIGAGSGLSTAAGFEYGGKTFLKHFEYMKYLYGYQDMYSAGFHSFNTKEEMWGYWSKFVYLNRYATDALPFYKKLFDLIKNKNYFVITTNVDHQFQKAGFDKKRLFYTQGDYGLFQCSKPCHKQTYDNRESILKMIDNHHNSTVYLSDSSFWIRPKITFQSPPPRPHPILNGMAIVSPAGTVNLIRFKQL